MAIIKIIIISKVCFYVLLIICKMLWCTTITSQMVFTIIMIIYTFILFVNVFTFFFSLFHIIVSFLVTKCVFEISFITMSIINITIIKIKQNQLDKFHDFLSKAHCFV